MESFVTEERLERSLARAAWKTPQQLRSLRAWRIRPTDERALKFFFHTNTQAKADALAAVLKARGYQPQVRKTGAFVDWTATWLEMASWAVSGLTPPLPMAEDVLLAWAQEMCRLGPRHDCEFEGWFCETPDFLEKNDDHWLQGRPDGTMDLDIYRWSAASEAALAENDVYWVSPGSGLGSLEPLQRYADKIRGLRSPSEALSLASIDQLPALEQIYLHKAPQAHGDYRKLPKLRGFRSLDAEKLDPRWLNNPSLRSVELRRPRKLKTLKALDGWQGLETLILSGAPLASLEGLAQVPALKELRLANCLSITDIGELPQAWGVERLEMFKLPKVQSFEPIAGLKALRWAFVHSRDGTLASYETFKHWPELQNAGVLLQMGRVDFEALARHPSAAELMLYTQKGFALPGEDELRRVLQAHGRQVRSVFLRPKDECPSIHVTFESPYWRLPAAHEGHARMFVE
ncbi:leucine-rich repeat domain-containing protein [Roseateles sp. NT4]|uniref:leucine-rich repeat domain-containing protein n=1 Tax=Roseateles sp. NT4 TaxID=3453715 RepID=UPI003EEC4C84